MTGVLGRIYQVKHYRATCSGCASTTDVIGAKTREIAMAEIFEDGWRERGGRRLFCPDCMESGRAKGVDRRPAFPGEVVK